MNSLGHIFPFQCLYLEVRGGGRQLLLCLNSKQKGERLNVAQLVCPQQCNKIH